jgi:pimeloyl-ACP methyl ester carboxylesterase
VILQELARDHRVIAFDLRGHGQSGKPHEPRAYGREMGLDVVRLLDHLGIARAHVVGYSLGGYFTSQLLTLHPERFLTATLVAGPGLFAWSAEQAADAAVEASGRERACVSRTLLTRLSPPDRNITEEEIKAQSAACFANPIRTPTRWRH